MNDARSNTTLVVDHLFSEEAFSYPPLLDELELLDVAP
jgi:hypothetical protein